MWRQHPGSDAGARGALLVEAVISAVVITVGLVGVSRALSAQLQGLESVEGYAVTTELAQRLAAELERPVQAGVPPSVERSGTFESPYDAYGWQLSAEPLEAASTGVLVSRVTITIRAEEGRGAAWSVDTVWPSELVPPAWY